MKNETICIRCGKRPVANRPGAKICEHCFVESMDVLFAEADAQQIVITGAQLEQLGRLADQADNLIGASRLPMPPGFHVEQLRSGLGDIVAALRAMYVQIASDDPWEVTP